MRVVSWNIRYGIEVERAARDLGAIEDLADADVVLLQEMDRPGTELVASFRGADYAFAAAAVTPATGRDLGNAIVSRWPISDAREIDLPHTARYRGQARSALHASVMVDGEDTAFYSVHSETVLLPLRRRLEQWRTVAHDVASLDQRRAVVVGGDFNTGRRRDVTALRSVMAEAGLAAVSERSGPTLRRFGSEYTLDHVFARGWTARHVTAVDSPASDHRPLRVDLQPSRR